MKLLACDLGGTKVLIGIFQQMKNGSPKLLSKQKYKSSNWNSFDEILDDFIRTQNLDSSLLVACFAIAGAIKNNAGQITNLSWKISSSHLKNKYNFLDLEIINDFAVQIYGIPFLRKNQFKSIQNIKLNPSMQEKDFHTIVGAGTGLGISRGIINKKGIQALPSEGGHNEFSPRSLEEWEFKEWFQKHLKINRVSSERVLSGQGLYYIAKWKLELSDLPNHEFKDTFNKVSESPELKTHIPALICEKANLKDELMTQVVRFWLNAYASFLGDIALHELCYGGLWISGGTAPKHLKYFLSDNFLKHFLNKGRLNNIVKTIPVRIIIDEEFGMFSAACRANMINQT
tara:strand:- start:3679 stop:4710 length:1032 start_codon:yes stop_codon:yes gene_type:complete